MSPRLHTVPELVDAGFAQKTAGVAAATKRGGVWTETSVGDFREKINCFALGLHELGVRRGDRVALHAENCTEWLIVDQAVLRLGAVTVPLYATQPADQVRFILEDSGARVYVVSGGLLEQLKPHVSGVATLERVVVIPGVEISGALTFDEVVEAGRKRPGDFAGFHDSAAAALTPDDLATIVYTSGTTGRPKGVMLTHGNLVFDALASLTNSPFDNIENRDKAVLSYLPLSHAFERMVSLLYLHIGHPIYFVEDVNEFREDLLTVRPVFFTTVPRLLEKIHAGVRTRAQTLSGLQRSTMLRALDLADSYDVEMSMGARRRLQFALADRFVFRKVRALFGGNLRSILSGGAALSPATMNFFNALGIFCGQGYGLTETSPVIATSMPGAVRAGSVGKPLPGVEIAVADDGEIVTRGPHVMKGYYKLPDETDSVKNASGWFSTGDIGRVDADGFLHITDRKKELFKLSTGKYVAPAPIEVRLGGSMFIEHVVLVGNESKFCAALVVLDLPAVRSHLGADASTVPDGDLSAHEDVVALIQQEIDVVNATLPPWEQIKSFRLLIQPFSVESGELTPTMKIKRRVVIEKYRVEIEAIYG